MRLSKNFTLEEFIYSKTALREHISNVANQDIIKNLGALVQNVLQPLRDRLNKIVNITSGYRCPELNKKVGGASNSQHQYGQAADIIVQGYTPEQVYRYIKASGLKYDQLILEVTRSGKWVHISYCIKHNRQQNLIYKNGVYTLDKK